MDFQFWLMAFIILVVMEFLTMGLTTIWFAIGALVSFFASLFGAAVWLQIVLFLVVSLVVLVVYIIGIIIAIACVCGMYSGD